MTGRPYEERKARSKFGPCERDVVAFILSRGSVTREQINEFLEDGRSYAGLAVFLSRLVGVAENQGIRIERRDGVYRVSRRTVRRAWRSIFGCPMPAMA